MESLTFILSIRLFELPMLFHSLGSVFDGEGSKEGVFPWLDRSLWGRFLPMTTLSSEVSLYLVGVVCASVAEKQWTICCSNLMLHMFCGA